jgi:hypothetical protein
VDTRWGHSSIALVVAVALTAGCAGDWVPVRNADRSIEGRRVTEWVPVRNADESIEGRRVTVIPVGQPPRGSVFNGVVACDHDGFIIAPQSFGCQIGPTFDTRRDAVFVRKDRTSLIAAIVVASLAGATMVFVALGIGLAHAQFL